MKHTAQFIDAITREEGEIDITVLYFEHPPKASQNEPYTVALVQDQCAALAAQGMKPERAQATFEHGEWSFEVDVIDFAGNAESLQYRVVETGDDFEAEEL